MFVLLGGSRDSGFLLLKRESVLFIGTQFSILYTSFFIYLFYL